MNLKNLKPKKNIIARGALIVMLTLPAAVPAGAQTGKNVAPKAEQNITQSIQIQQQTQKNRTKWENEKSSLILEYEQLLQEKEILEEENRILSARQKNQQELNRSLTLQKKESIRVVNELMPFLKTVYEQLETLVSQDAPFLKEERGTRLNRLAKVMADPDVTIAEKYRKVMEALFIESEYGSTIEVYQDRILMADTDGEETLGNIFRLGRVSLFFLSLDNSRCGVFNPRDGQWQPLPKEMLPAIRSAVEIGSKRRPVELLSLPVGRLAGQGGAQ